MASGKRRIVLITGASRGVIALKREYASAMQALSVAIADEPDLELFLMDSFYPAGDEQVLVHEITEAGPAANRSTH